MKPLKKFALLTVNFVFSSIASAGCIHEGVTYDEGAIICSGGWLMRCSASGAWMTEGYCHYDQKDWHALRFEVIDLESKSGPKNAVLRPQGPAENRT